MKRLFAATISLTLSTVLFAQSELESMVGRPAPAFKMTDTKGKVHTNKSLKGKVVLLDFWATWCGPCKAASPTMQKLHAKYAKKGLVVVGANTFEEGDSKSAAIKYMKEHKYSYTFTYGNDALARALGVRGIPAFVFLDKTGKIAKALVGFGGQRPAEMEALVKNLLAK